MKLSDFQVMVLDLCIDMDVPFNFIIDSNIHLSLDSILKEIEFLVDLKLVNVIFFLEEKNTLEGEILFNELLQQKNFEGVFLTLSCKYTYNDLRIEKIIEKKEC